MKAIAIVSITLACSLLYRLNVGTILRDGRDGW